MAYHTKTLIKTVELEGENQNLWNVSVYEDDTEQVLIENFELWAVEGTDVGGAVDMAVATPVTVVMTYAKERSQSYPAIEDQLDMLWHEVNETGSISKSGSWFTGIKKVKTDYPKT